MTNAPQRHTWFWPPPGPQRFCGVCLAARSRAHITRSLMCMYSGKQDPVSWLQENGVLPMLGGLLRATARRCRLPQGARRQECNDRCICAALPERSNHPARNVLWNGPARTLASRRQGWCSVRVGGARQRIMYPAETGYADRPSGMLAAGFLPSAVPVRAVCRGWAGVGSVGDDQRRPYFLAVCTGGGHNVHCQRRGCGCHGPVLHEPVTVCAGEPDDSGMHTLRIRDSSSFAGSVVEQTDNSHHPAGGGHIVG